MKEPKNKRSINKNDFIGRIFGKLFILKFDSLSDKYKCRCLCGNSDYTYRERSAFTGFLRGISKMPSCGCYLKEHIKNLNLKHGFDNTKVYFRYRSMLSRCYNVKDIYYHNYGGRGIKVCDEWLDKENGFINYEKHVRSLCKDYETQFENGYQIDRIDNDGNYCPENTQFIHSSENSDKRNNSKIFYAFGEEGTIRKLLNKFGDKSLTYKIILKRINKSKWSIEKALITPLTESKSHVK